MSKKLILILLAFSLSLFTLKAQKDIKRTWHWNFGINAGLDFSSGKPVPITNSAMQAIDQACSTISDTAGNLLFYTNGQTVYNRNNIAMPNGSGLLAESDGFDVLIAPQPLNDSMFYVFTNDTAVFYSIVNINLNGGLGDVTTKNALLFKQGASTKIAGVMDANDTDIWVVSTKIFTDSFYAYHLTPKGLNTIPVISKCGRADSAGPQQMKFSPSGQKLAVAFEGYEGVEILNFNDTTGIVYSNQPIDLPFCGYNNCDVQGVEFSPDESKIYWTYDNNPGKYLYQMNLAAGSPSAIIASVTFIDSVNTPNAAGAGDLQLAPDGKIYVAKVDDSLIGVIKHPNSLGVSCTYEDTGVFLHNKYSMYGLPNFIASYFYKPGIGTSVNSLISPAPTINVFPNPSKGIFTINVSFLTVQSSVYIYNILGELIYKQRLNSIQSAINISANPKGVYLCRIVSDKGEFIGSGKIVIQ